jgi:hypothetical protein
VILRVSTPEDHSRSRARGVIFPDPLLVDHLADLALWRLNSPRTRWWLLIRGRWRRRCCSGCGRPLIRAGGGLRHPLLGILVLAACATLVSGNDSVTAIRQWREPRRRFWPVSGPGITRYTAGSGAPRTHAPAGPGHC